MGIGGKLCPSTVLWQPHAQALPLSSYIIPKITDKVLLLKSFYSLGQAQLFCHSSPSSSLVFIHHQPRAPSSHPTRMPGSSASTPRVRATPHTRGRRGTWESRKAVHQRANDIYLCGEELWLLSIFVFIRKMRTTSFKNPNLKKVPIK